MDMPMPPALPDQPRYAGFWIRLLAYIIDAFVLGAMTFPLLRVLGMMGIGEHSGNVMSIAISWMYFAVFESSAWMASPGKKVLGLIVTDEQGGQLSVGRATRRYFAKILSARGPGPHADAGHRTADAVCAWRTGSCAPA